MKKWILLGIIAIAFLLRVWNIGGVPASPDWDEAALGYNAYSILHTGKDEYGKFLPVVLRSFDDYKPALYTYLIIPLLPLLDLSVVAVRLPSVLLGTVTVFLTYILARILLKKDSLALLSAFLLAISPWHIQFSRIAFEANVALFFNVLMVVSLLLTRKKPWYIFISVIAAACAIYTYQSAKVFTPILFFIVIALYYKEFLQISKKYITAAVLVGLIVIAPMMFYIATNRQSLLRAQTTSVFYDTSNLADTTAKLAYDDAHHDVLGKIFDNRRVFYAQEVLLGYLSHYNLNWLFVTGDNPRHHAPNMGLLYLWELPFLLIGIYFLLYGPFERKSKLLILLWFLAAPVPASITTGVPHAVRTLNFLPTFQLFTACGLFFAYLRLSEWKITHYWRYGLVSLIAAFAAGNIIFYLDQYFVQLNYYYAKDWQYGYAQAMPIISANQDGYKHIVVTNKGPLDQSYMFFLFYLKYDPATYQAETKNASGGFAETHSFGKYEFRPFTIASENPTESTLFVGRPEDVVGGNILGKVSYPDGTDAIAVADKGTPHEQK